MNRTLFRLSPWLFLGTALAVIAACLPATASATRDGAAPAHTVSTPKEAPMTITITANGQTLHFALNDSDAAKALFAQLPLTAAVEDYGHKEKIFTPPSRLPTAHTPLVRAARPGTLAYFAPWGNVVLFYGDFGSAPGLYELGRATQGAEHIRSLTGTLHVQPSSAPQD